MCGTIKGNACENHQTYYSVKLNMPICIYTALAISLETCSVDSNHLSSVTDTLNLCNFAKQNYLQMLLTCYYY